MSQLVEIAAVIAVTAILILDLHHEDWFA